MTATFPRPLLSVILASALGAHVHAGEPTTTMAPEPQEWSQVPPPPSPILSSDWEFTLSPYLYASGLNGTVGVGSAAADVDIDFSDIFDNLDAGAIASFEARKGRFGFLFDGIWLKLSDSVGTGLPTYTKLDIKVEEVLLGGYFSYRAIANSDLTLDLLAGARYTYVDSEIQLKSSTAPDIEESGSVDWIDPVIGLRARYNLSDKWFLNGIGEIGGFGVSSDLVWQLYLGLGYTLSDNVDLQVGWRHIGIDYEGSDVVYDTEMDGLVVGLNFKF